VGANVNAGARENGVRARARGRFDAGAVVAEVGESGNAFGGRGVCRRARLLARRRRAVRRSCARRLYWQQMRWHIPERLFLCSGQLCEKKGVFRKGVRRRKDWLGRAHILHTLGGRLLRPRRKSQR
jgi:hypothetical protein